MPGRKTTLFCLCLAALVGAACGNRRADEGPRFGESPRSGAPEALRVAIHPLHNPAKLIEAYQPLVDYLNARVHSAHLVLEASRDYADFEAKCSERKFAFILPNPWQTLRAIEGGYHVIAMAGDPADFRGIFIVRRDGGVKRPEDLRGKAVSYPSPTALAACIMPQYYLHAHGLDVNRDIENRYVGSQESSIMNVWLGQTAAGATWPPPWRAFCKDHPEKAAELAIVWETEPLVNNSFMARDDVPAALGDTVRALLVGLADCDEGRAILAGMQTARFTAAGDADYDEVRRYIARFERDVRKVVRQP